MENGLFLYMKCVYLHLKHKIELHHHHYPQKVAKRNKLSFLLRPLPFALRPSGWTLCPPHNPIPDAAVFLLRARVGVEDSPDPMVSAALGALLALLPAQSQEQWTAVPSSPGLPMVI